ncbi:MAG: glycosyltransferase [Anaerolineaceae bacterium]|nr:glycosyltransferase [Anaerolineaceae bacterium]
MRVLYFQRDDTVHDRRFLDVLSRMPVEIFALRLENDTTRTNDWHPPHNIKYVSFTKNDKFRWRNEATVVSDLQRIFREIKPDVVHAGPVDLCGFLAARAGMQPLISMSWGYDLLVNAVRSMKARWRVQYALKQTRVLLTDCQTVSDKAVTLGYATDPIVTFPWGVDLQVFHPSTDRKIHQTSYDPDHIVLLSTRSMEQQYGCDVITESFIHLARNDKRLQLIMLGDGSQRQKIIQKISLAGMAKRVRFVGTVPEFEMPSYFHACDLYISASHSDGSSVSLLQAMACGLPPLVSDIPGNREWVSAGENGWLFVDGDSDSLANKILEAANSPKLRKLYGAASRKIVETRADWGHNSARLMDAYRMAIDRRVVNG